MKRLMFWVCAGVFFATMQTAAQAPQSKPAPVAKPVAFRTSSKSTALASISNPSSAKSDDPSTVSNLPVRRVVLYKNGVGYFEHLGGIRGNENVHIDFTSGQLNDVLKSLTVLDLSGGQITGVGYNSEAPLNQLLGALRLPLGQETSVSQFLAALRGAKLEVRSGTSITDGRLLSVEQKTRSVGDTTVNVDVISLVSESGEVREVDLTPSVSVRLLESDLNQEVGRYLNLIAAQRDQDLRRMVISTAGNGDRKLYVSYISEVPVWKTTYRIVLPSKANSKPLLQGWAIVDNTVGEDWNNVQLSLVAGAPQSFTMQLSQPYYSRRPSVAMPNTVQLTPQTHEGTMRAGFAGISGRVTDATGSGVPDSQVRLFSNSGQLLASTTSDGEGNYQFNDLPSGLFRLIIGKPNFKTSLVQNVAVNNASQTRQDVALQLGAVSQQVTVEGSMPLNGRNFLELQQLSSGTPYSDGFQAGVGGGIGSGAGGGIGPGGYSRNNLDQARQDVQAAAYGQDIGDLFEYRLKEPVTIRKNQSALVPIVQADVEAEKVSLWNASLNSARPLYALWLRNSSGLTLDGGSFSVIEDEAFAGEGLLDPVKPDERRLLSYAVDLAVRVNPDVDNEMQQVRHVRIYRGVMYQTREVRERKTYTIRNEDTSARVIVIEHPVRNGWVLASDAPKPEEASAAYYRFRKSAEPKSTTKLTIAESMHLIQSYSINNLTGDQLELFVDQKSIDPDIEKALRKVLEQKDRVAGLRNQISQRKNDMKSIFDDQQRLRENMKSLKGSPEERTLTQRYTRQLDDQETHLETLRREVAQIEVQEQQAQSELDKMIEELSIDVAL